MRPFRLTERDLHPGCREIRVEGELDLDVVDQLQAALQRSVAAFLMAAVAFVIAIGCGDQSEDSGSAASPEAGTPAADQRREDADAEVVTRSRCPTSLPDCQATEGRIVYVERVDPDGDGDAHFVIADPQGITLRGLTAIDVRRGLRPQPLPGIGDLISAAGPVQTGSYGQSQIHAIELHVADR